MMRYELNHFFFFILSLSFSFTDNTTSTLSINRRQEFFSVRLSSSKISIIIGCLIAHGLLRLGANLEVLNPT